MDYLFKGYIMCLEKSPKGDGFYLLLYIGQNRMLEKKENKFQCVAEFMASVKKAKKQFSSHIYSMIFKTLGT